MSTRTAAAVAGRAVTPGITASLKWTTLSQIIRMVLQLGSQVVLARLLSPADFGVAAMAFVITGFASVLAESGIQAAVIQRPVLDQRILASALAVNLVSGALVMGSILAIAPLATRFYAEPQVDVVLYLSAPAILISAATGVHRGLLERAMQFRRLMVVEIGAAAIGTSVAVVAAVAGAGVMALALNLLVTAAAGTVGTLVAGPWRPRAWPSRAAVKELSGFSGNLLGFNAINYWSRNLDNLLVAKYLGAAQAGFYTRAYVFLMLPLTQVSGVLGRVMFPSFASVQDDHAMIRELYLRAVRAISAIMWLPLIVFAITADRVIPLILGPQWTETASIASIFAVIGMAQVILTTVGWLFLSQGATRPMLIWGLMNTAAYAGAFAAGVALGSAQWVALTYGTAVLACGLPCLRAAAGLVGLSLTRIIRSLTPPAICAAAAAVSALPGYAIGQPVLSFAFQTLVPSACFIMVATALDLEPIPLLGRRAAGLWPRVQR